LTWWNVHRHNVVAGEEVATPAISRMVTGVAPVGRMFCESMIWEKWLLTTKHDT
jgi:hypothetical protein